MQRLKKTLVLKITKPDIMAWPPTIENLVISEVPQFPRGNELPQFRRGKTRSLIAWDHFNILPFDCMA
jgi:hypothetical protein